ncbi:MAG: hypothetical protein M3Q31_05305 [Actinomycetota bacterium]|nr:hypothetical protein [Actinomycetota bacterium]
MLALLTACMPATASARASSAPRCSTVKPDDPLNLVCGMLQSYLQSRKIYDKPFARVQHLYGFDPVRISDKGRAAWRDLLKRAEAPLRVGEETCSPRRAKLRAQVPKIDQEVLARMCVTVRDYGDLYLVLFVIISAHHAPSAENKAALRTLEAGIKANFPLLVKALRADPTLTGPV